MSIFGIKTKKEREKEREEYFKQLEQQAIREQQEKDDQFLAELAEKDKLIKKCLHQMEEEQLLRQQKEIEKYKKSPRVIQAAEDFAKTYIEKLGKIDRNSKVAEIKFEYGFGCSYNCNDFCVDKILYLEKTCGDFEGVLCFYFDKPAYYPLINLDKENLSPIRDKKTIQLVLKAISSLAYDYIIEQFNMDYSGTEYSLVTIDHLEYEGRYPRLFLSSIGKYEVRNPDICCGMMFSYKAPNGNYIAPKEWL